MNDFIDRLFTFGYLFLKPGFPACLIQEQNFFPFWALLHFNRYNVIEMELQFDKMFLSILIFFVSSFLVIDTGQYW